MPRPTRWIKIVGLVVLIVTIFIALSHEYVLKSIGQFLVYEQSPQKADVIVVLNGRDTERSLAAVDLYNQGFANLIVIASGSKQPGCDEFWKRVGGNFNGRNFFQQAIEAMGIPKKSFQLLREDVASTYDEANVTKQYLLKNGYKSILLVTSKWHSKRAYLTFKSMLKEAGIRITIFPSKYDTFKPDVWWQSNNDAELVFNEYMRFMYYILSLRISPLELVRSM